MPDSSYTDLDAAGPSACAKLIKRGTHVSDEWVLSRDSETLPEPRPAIVPFALWEQTEAREALAPWLPSDVQLTAELADRLATSPLVAIDFPAFTDGRGYSVARLLRERFGYAGEIRAIGDVLVDQLYYMSRCGFDAMALRSDQNVETALNALASFSVSYQPAIDLAEPLFARRRRERVAL